jgi:hypothetical protein
VKRLRSLKLFPELLGYPAVSRIVCQLLWVESLPAHYPDGSEEAVAVGKLCKRGQTVIADGRYESYRKQIQELPKASRYC